MTTTTPQPPPQLPPPAAPPSGATERDEDVHDGLYLQFQGGPLHGKRQPKQPIAGPWWVYVRDDGTKLRSEQGDRRAAILSGVRHLDEGEELPPMDFYVKSADIRDERHGRTRGGGDGRLLGYRYDHATVLWHGRGPGRVR